VIDDIFTEEEKMVRDSARQFAQEKLMPGVRKAYNDETFDKHIMK
jgi:glutaryl-CoA dehydrogenase